MLGFEQIILGIVQGFTEFLPVSSSGHLAIISKLLSIEPQISYFAALHFATFLAVFMFVKDDIVKITKGLVQKDKSSRDLSFKLIISTIPAVIVGLLLKSYFTSLYGSLKVIGVLLAITGIMMILSDKMTSGTKSMYDISHKDALLVGLTQAFAILPGISRSGSTLFTSVYRGMKKEDAFKYSFIMSLPITAGAGILELKDVALTFDSVLGLVFATISGLIALSIVKKLIIDNRLKIFGYYCILMSFFVIVFL
ncbi:undecaprenyl-diphosphate phosphatase [Methanococcus voltae]|uniref:Undecaprenyl-diphosphatase n=1 Tax=Methanococcus voltae (strain ATCC BAA-1334 / A3) TaxID=456320 RepID=D7DRQ8_METV3|nr:undecaprenyl-diphosphate phosphatase [Methanococcus voltae]MCS3901136.1 undecaprenyl-diphosphatase [Methanococcus voltae]